MRIAYLVNRYPAVSHSFIRREILGLEALGHDVVRFSIRPVPGDLPDPADVRERERTRIVLKQGAGALIGAALAMLARPGRLLRAMRAAFAMAGYGLKPKLRHLAYLIEAAWLARAMVGVDHLHAHFGTNPAAVARLVHILSGVPYSFTVHGPEEFDFPLGYALGAKVADSKFTVAISSFGRSQLMRWADHRDWAKLEVVRCGVDAAFADAAPPPPQPGPELCCVARLSGQKGLPLLIEAAALLRARGVAFHLTLVGDGEMRGEIEAMIARAGLGDRITITGYLSAAGVRAKIQASRAMVLPSFAEGLPVVIMEALALSVPVLTTAIAGIPELVDDACGWVVPAGSVGALADAMQAVLAEDPAKLRAMGEVGRARVLALHDARANAAALAGVDRAMRAIAGLALLVTLPLAVIDMVFLAELLLGLFPSRARAIGASPKKIALLVPAHNEAAAIRGSVEAMRAAAPEGARILVVAHNCSDATAEEALAGGAEVYRLDEPDRRGKGYALAGGRDVLAADPPEAVVAIDADCLPAPGAIAILAAEAMRTGQAIQGCYLFRSTPGDGPVVQVSNFAILCKNFLRQRGAARLGGPALLTGSGMAFPWSLIANRNLATGNIVEDLALGVDLVREGHPPRFEERALIWSAPSTSAGTQTQRARWEGGFLATAKRFGLPLIARGVTGGGWPMLWLGLNLVTLPLTLLLIANAGAVLGWGLLVLLGVPAGPFVTMLALATAVVAAVLLAWAIAGGRCCPARRCCGCRSISSGS